MRATLAFTLTLSGLLMSVQSKPLPQQQPPVKPLAVMIQPVLANSVQVAKVSTNLLTPQATAPKPTVAHPAPKEKAQPPVPAILTTPKPYYAGKAFVTDDVPMLGSCGTWMPKGSFFAGINTAQMANPANPNNNPKCDKHIRVRYGGKEVVLTIKDTCEGCQVGDIIISPAAVQILGSQIMQINKTDVTWQYVDTT
ncbi:hypothetical protein H4R33_002828 [Dimargaris cristalligena]|uniref:RlpA-like double-psi beta-barrel-protein domain-containing protein-containing protein n=1 Tax=Dimargaris cristalligena TaxID=215637 RepID=A0A4P9ZZ83_9FUNG|nr:hypothetical protein H4R33_002828 [Dimargaris cristalligena]RKP39076.1 hypothetical protein BJ085DRAFT_29971 [Dimargaris cristalligena]|eukprot:RKP39076.1 hypothetical protein BJ085DRAFT_29971 [Dimargaris cristalligena]